jgi:hypothetical protein
MAKAKKKIVSKSKPARKPATIVEKKEPVFEPKPIVKPEPSRSMKMVEYKVAEGHSLTSKRGILGPGTVLKPGLFQGGIENLERLVKKGHVVKE